MELEWMEPPAAAHRRGADSVLGWTIGELQKRPGDWARVKQGVGPSSTKPFKKHGCEAVARRSEKVAGKYDIFARWPATRVQEAARRQEAAKQQAVRRTVGQARKVVLNGREYEVEVRPGETPKQALQRAGIIPAGPRPSTGGAYSLEGRRARGVPEDGV